MCRSEDEDVKLGVQYIIAIRTYQYLLYVVQLCLLFVDSLDPAPSVPPSAIYLFKWFIRHDDNIDSNPSSS